jgi:hypothetical protein
MILANRLLGLLLAATLLGGCASAVKIGVGEAVVADRIKLPIDAAWNQLPGPFSGTNSSALWTTEGVTIDQVNFYVGVKDGAALAQNSGNEQRPLNFKSAMQAHEIAALFESLYTRDGSIYTLDKLEGAEFLGQRGWRVQYTLVRKFDDVKLNGSIWATVRNGELYAMSFAAPALGFYPRLAPKVEQLAAKARFNG